MWALAEAVPARCEALVRLAAGAASPFTELSALRRCDVDLARQEQRVARAYVEPVRSPARFGPPKSDLDPPTCDGAGHDSWPAAGRFLRSYLGSTRVRVLHRTHRSTSLWRSP